MIRFLKSFDKNDEVVSKEDLETLKTHQLFNN